MIGRRQAIANLSIRRFFGLLAELRTDAEREFTESLSKKHVQVV